MPEQPERDSGATAPATRSRKRKISLVVLVPCVIVVAVAILLLASRGDARERLISEVKDQLIKDGDLFRIAFKNFDCLVNWEYVGNGRFHCAVNYSHGGGHGQEYEVRVYFFPAFQEDEFSDYVAETAGYGGQGMKKAILEGTVKAVALILAYEKDHMERHRFLSGGCLEKDDSTGAFEWRFARKHISPYNLWAKAFAAAYTYRRDESFEKYRRHLGKAEREFKWR